MRKKFWLLDPDFDPIRNYTAYGYCWAP